MFLPSVPGLRSTVRAMSTKASDVVLHPEAKVLVAVAPAAGHDSVGHPECAARVPAILQTLTDQGLDTHPSLAFFTEFSPANPSSIIPVHNEKYVAALERMSSTTSETIFVEPAPTYLTATTYKDALTAAGAVMGLVDQVVAASRLNQAASGSSSSSVLTPVGFAVARPPGHHAVPASAMGFCLLNNAAVAARHAQQVHNLQRICIFDFDVHHGNGTADVFESDPSVLFISTHQDGSYPNTGKVNIVGTGDGEGYTVNVPLPGDSGHTAALMAWDEVVEPAIRRFQPDMIIISAGFDAHWRDPLAGLQFRNTTYHVLGTKLAQLAGELCGGKIVMVLEGGYDLKALGESVANLFRGVLGEEALDTFNPDLLFEEPVDKIKAALKEVRGIHSL